MDRYMSLQLFSSYLQMRGLLALMVVCVASHCVSCEEDIFSPMDKGWFVSVSVSADSVCFPHIDQCVALRHTIKPSATN